MHVSDFSDFVIKLIKIKPKIKILNVGSGKEISIKKLAIKLKKISGFKGKLIFNKSYTDGVYRKLLNSKNAKSFGFIKKISLDKGLTEIFKKKFKD